MPSYYGIHNLKFITMGIIERLAYFAFADWIRDNDVAKVKSPDNRNYNRWIVTDLKGLIGDELLYLTTPELFDFFIDNYYQYGHLNTDDLVTIIDSPWIDLIESMRSKLEEHYIALQSSRSIIWEEKQREVTGSQEWAQLHERSSFITSSMQEIKIALENFDAKVYQSIIDEYELN